MSRPPDELRPLPKPVRLKAPGGDEKRDKPKREPPKKIPPADKSLRHFEQAQRAHGRRRPPPKKTQKKRAPGRYAKEFGIVCLGLICVGLVVLSIMLLTGDNALAVYVDDTRVGYLPLNRETREWDADYVQAQAAEHRAVTVAATIVVNERVSLQPVRANRRYTANATITEVIRQVSEAFTYRVAAAAIYVNGERIALLRAETLAESVRQHFVGAFTTTNTVEAAIVGWELRTLMVEDGDFDAPGQAISLLDRQVEAIIPHTVRDGETVYGIALRNGIAPNILLTENNLTPQSIIRPGDIINIRSTRPFVTVRTVEQETRTEVIPMEVITQYDDRLAVGVINRTTEGRDGERSLTVRTTHENGDRISEEIVAETILVHPEARTEIVGTSETAVPDWRD